MHWLVFSESVTDSDGSRVTKHDHVRGHDKRNERGRLYQVRGFGTYGSRVERQHSDHERKLTDLSQAYTYLIR